MTTTKPEKIYGNFNPLRIQELDQLISPRQ